MDSLGQPKESSISVAVRIRPLTAEEQLYLQEEDDENMQKSAHENDIDNDTIEYDIEKENTDYEKNQGLRTRASNKYNSPFQIKKILEVVDDRMLIFDPKSSALDEIDNNITARLTSNNIRRGYGAHDIRIGRHNKRHKEHKFIFDRLFDEDSSQDDIYQNTAKPSIDAVLDGYNSTIFAYGATGCGKTYTITGTPENPGIIFLALQELFTKIENQPGKNTSIQVSYLEIYNEMIKDLLNLETSPKKLTLLENQHKEIIVSNLTKVETENVEDVMDVIMKGNYNRTVSPTEANLTSSRSHAVIQVYVTQTPSISDLYEKNTRSVLSIIDLAGSERASATKNKGARLHEGANINKSLLALGNCINALCDSKRITHVPYRDSKLTRLLKFSLGGNCKTVMIVCVSPSSRHYDETLNALKFANRAKEIKTKVVRNRMTVMKHVGSYMKIISEQKRRIYELETLMDSSVKGGILKYNEQRNNVKTQLSIMIERLWNNVKRCDHLKLEKIQIVAQRKMLLIYNRQINDFYRGLNKFDLENKLLSLKENLLDIVENLKAQIISLEESYNKRTELDIILLETSDAFLEKLRELDGWSDEDEQYYMKEVEYLKSDIEKQVFYESSILFDAMLSENEDIGNLNSLPDILAQYLCIIEDVANNIRTVEEARMTCYQLSDNLVESCKQQLKTNFSFPSIDMSNINRKKRRNSGNGTIINTDTNNNTNDAISESSFVRQGNRINSINNKLMRINLSNENLENKYKYNHNHNNSLSEIESSLILDNDYKQNRTCSNSKISSQSGFLQSESTPHSDAIIDRINEIGSPEILTRNGNKKIVSDLLNESNTIQEEEDISNSSVIIRMEKTELQSPHRNRKSSVSSPVKTIKTRNNNGSGKLTSRRLIASPPAKITSPHRLAGFDSHSSNFQIKLRESMSGLEMFGDINNENVKKLEEHSTQEPKMDVDI